MLFFFVLLERTRFDSARVDDESLRSTIAATPAARTHTRTRACVSARARTGRREIENGAAAARERRRALYFEGVDGFQADRMLQWAAAAATAARRARFGSAPK